jgi:hypothetical protein
LPRAKGNLLHDETAAQASRCYRLRPGSSLFGRRPPLLALRSGGMRLPGACEAPRPPGSEPRHGDLRADDQVCMEKCRGIALLRVGIVSRQRPARRPTDGVTKVPPTEGLRTSRRGTAEPKAARMQAGSLRYKLCHVNLRAGDQVWRESGEMCSCVIANICISRCRSRLHKVAGTLRVPSAALRAADSLNAQTSFHATRQATARGACLLSDAARRGNERGMSVAPGMQHGSSRGAR